ncbi:tetratricopeptide repeat protein [Sporosarcina luteola]|uniref:tetratricopeptide repeat protein n=1 Tax=Sporosarcina luteola TaxID=582850 RepID=UPI00204043D2|nr:tetratricopeptide repeat protein [Sporosarcina luteola]MCM3711763.1 tetratricopeptide repeat protein [Sporosarcina luteola]
MAKKFDEALQIFEDEKNLLREHQLGTELNEAVNLYERGYIYYLKNLNDQALPLMQQSLKHAELSGDKVCVACALRGLGEIYRANGNREMAVIYFKKALLAFKEAENQRGAKEIEELLSLDN